MVIEFTAGFIMTLCKSISKIRCFFIAIMFKRHKSKSEKNKLIMYPPNPMSGIRRQVKTILVIIEVTELIKVVFVCPKPFSILDITLEVYMNIHIIDNVLINMPALLLLKIMYPNSRPNTRNIQEDTIPSTAENAKEIFMPSISFLLLFVACAKETSESIKRL